ncbi:MAG: hypothetical protein IJ390_09235 [Lachnospiraceae bacterium]|nr:hypothetical protein [Lachnospiraceae bacterium]
MENQKEEKEVFSYTYSAKQQEEIKNIRKKYMPQEENKMEQLRRLDRSATQKATMASIGLGVIGTMLLGIGMCCCMVWAGAMFVPGVIVGLAGIVLVSLAYPIFIRTLKKERERIAPEILRLTEELMK